MTRSVASDVVVPLTPDLGPVRCGCAPSRRRSAHHDRLLAVESDPDAVLDLFEIAVTWGELDYTHEDVLSPESWLDFASDHVWRCPDRVLRLFALAADVALRGAPVTGVRCAL
ncbi:hypothetical protein PHK61_07690 [Actinomycetospora lutea]|uniref:hypothetical protein n=1 Tax=Actinomycetospora lutea TaxID=663604 RepID=UPI002365B452|nr:hypothetical protein [Actinomycetospora lutea]MDD7938298.1 hypothetical protein [Actinomycetospora lutea]